jgi:DNA-binding NtrC family response regulator
LLAAVTGVPEFEDLDYSPVSDPKPAADRHPSTPPADASLEDFERTAILRALGATAGNRRAAAKRLGIAPSTLYAKMKKYGLQE